ncbi:flagellar FliJ family protein [Curtobacterium sp. MCBD17_040]|uniref:flagellar FliJ family protein n=1 Tax=Curtobacterium sp. MCBD17_040 TaxID=2175674 RepID=UPI000DA8D049|nr:flagellar FliJ family protein [Curtobacterium sp. MCBD17_040]WIB65579.1 flagellar FliJ family protein [Curtobacterium sp. MCBD17_040]
MTEFRLTNLLRIRRLQEQQAASDLADANSSVSRVVQRRADIRAQLAGTTVDATGVSTIAAVAGARAAAASMLADLAGMHRAAEVTRAAASAAYTTARTETLGLEKLEDRHARQEARERERQEQAALDEIATSRRHRTIPGAAQ